MTEYIVKLEDDDEDYEEMFYGNIRDCDELVRCKDCRFQNTGECEHKFGLLVANEENYCSYAERKEEHEACGR